MSANGSLEGATSQVTAQGGLTSAWPKQDQQPPRVHLVRRRPACSPSRCPTQRRGSVSTLLLGSTRPETLAGQHAQERGCSLPSDPKCPLPASPTRASAGGPIKSAAS